ncbi:MAG: DUF29 domain-containing protein [Agitococcus sp.]|nr:DUF29 domain-containing protein [Agitococcus sp.]MCC6373483.1 DUF29 domain-containing protein [Moraxellaceae bacterium]HQV80996.1 DUF29 domain-containing protein [Agitococcus sp.]
MNTAYKTDVVAWANEQAAFIRAGRFDLLDLENIAEEIESVGKSEKRELASRMSLLLAHLLKWQYQPVRRGSSWERTIRIQRKEVIYELADTPSLKPLLRNTEWMDLVWGKAVSSATDETGLDSFPEICPWTPEQILSQEFFPD